MDEKTAVLLPAYKPAEGFVALCRELRDAGFDVWVVDDGSGEPYQALFEEAASVGCTVIKHAVNLGKGRALKTGINAVLNHEDSVCGLVTADADGQHTFRDILRVAEAMRETPNALVTGSRKLLKNMPVKSLIGNAVTRYAYRFVTGIQCDDTQTGLRGIPAGALPNCLRIPGERYEYEMNMLLKLREMRLSLHEVEIETIYIDHNKGSHFKPLRDALHIFGAIFRFALVSLLSFLVDYSLYALFLNVVILTPALSYACARAVSSLFNYAVNHAAVFGMRGSRGSIWRYYLLAITLMLVGSGLVELLASVLGYSATWMKIPVDILLFIVSYWAQREFVFRD